MIRDDMHRRLVATPTVATLWREGMPAGLRVQRQPSRNANRAAPLVSPRAAVSSRTRQPRWPALALTTRMGLMAARRACCWRWLVASLALGASIASAEAPTPVRYSTSKLQSR